MMLRKVRYASGPHDSRRGSLVIAEGRLTGLLDGPVETGCDSSQEPVLDLEGFLVLPGLINAHDHLHLALHPRLGNPPYRNYMEWGDDIHVTFADLIANYKTIPKQVRFLWGGIRNLICGVTTVCHHDASHPELLRDDFPVRVVERYGWGHSLALGGDLAQLHAAVPKGTPFIVHACEGVDDVARQEIFGLDELGVVGADTILVHGLALDDAGVARMLERGASLIVCPSSNEFLFETLPCRLIQKIEGVSLGSDSPITSIGDLLDEVRFATKQCQLTATEVYRMVTRAPAKSLRLQSGEGSICEGGRADLIAVRDTDTDPAERLCQLSVADIELVVLGGQVQLASDEIYERLPALITQGMEHLWVDGHRRWLRAPARRLMEAAESVLGQGNVRLGGKEVRLTEQHRPLDAMRQLTT